MALDLSMPILVVDDNSSVVGVLLLLLEIGFTTADETADGTHGSISEELLCSRQCQPVCAPAHSIRVAPLRNDLRMIETGIRTNTNDIVS
jgi:hypothetical protein